MPSWMDLEMSRKFIVRVFTSEELIEKYMALDKKNNESMSRPALYVSKLIEISECVNFLGAYCLSCKYDAKVFTIRSLKKAQAEINVSLNRRLGYGWDIELEFVV